LSSDILTSVLGEWEGYRIKIAERRHPHGPEKPPEVWVELQPVIGRPHRCSGCHQEVLQVHDRDERWVRDLPILDAATWLLVPRLRVACPRCGPKLEELPWLESYARVTRRFAENVARLCQVLPVAHVAKETGLGWDTVKAIDQVYMERTLGPVDLSEVDEFVMDEFAIHKGQQYATVFYEPVRRRVLWVCRGRERKDIRPFFRMLGREGRARIRAVGMDMHRGYEDEVRARCKNAQIVYDLFHVAKNYGQQVIDRVRVDEANRWTENKKQREIIKGSRWLLLRNKENLSDPKDRVRLRELLKANHQLMTVYVLKDDLKHLWDYRYPAAARRFFKDWFARAMRSKIDPLKRFARNLRERLPGILAHCRFPLNTSVLEGVNNKIKVIKRMAYGFRDLAYFFLKIRAAFPGNAG
jgi:transposase